MNRLFTQFSWQFVQILRPCTLSILIFLCLALSAPLAFPQPDPSLLNQRRYVPRTDVAPEIEPPVRPVKPIPPVWIIAGLAVFLAASGLVLVKAVRVWQAANLFGRQYRFPAPDSAALRLGGPKSGGEMATISFRELLTVNAILKSESENA